jgi:hypothetical protein
MHVTTSIFGCLYLPYLIRIIINAKIDPDEIAEISSMDEKAGPALAKEVERLKKK